MYVGRFRICVRIFIGEIFRSGIRIFFVLMVVNKLCMCGNIYCIDIYENEYMVIVGDREFKKKEGFFNS